MGYSYKGSLSFGLVYIPIRLQKCVQQNEVSFNMLDKNTMSRVKYKKTCVDCGGRELAQEDIVKGYEYEEEKYIVFEDADFDKIKSEKDKNITIERFVDLGEIDPIYYDTPYYVVPTGAENAYALLLRAMEEENKVGIAKTVLGTKETLIAIRARGGAMCLNTLFFHDELQKNPAKDISAKPSDKELEIAKLIIRNMADAFEPQNYKDAYRERLMNAINDKIAGRELAAPKEQFNRVNDLMDALRMTLEKSGSGKTEPPAKPVKKTPPKKTERARQFE